MGTCVRLAVRRDGRMPGAGKVGRPVSARAAAVLVALAALAVIAAGVVVLALHIARTATP